MKIYTRTGDDGLTALFGGERVYKDDLRVDAYGQIDELNSFLGSLLDTLSHAEIIQFCENLQHVLFNIGSIIATPDAKMQSKLPVVLEQDIVYIEQCIDKYTEQLPLMTNFVLPAGHPQVSAAHICRTVCRRAERALVRLGQHTELNSQEIICLKMLNRLSDYFFVLARFLTQLNGANEVIWKKDVQLSS